MRFIICLAFVINCWFGSAQTTNITSYPIGYPDTTQSVIYQLQHYPAPRYYPHHQLLRLVNWMNPDYMGSRGIKGVNNNKAIYNAYDIQKELITTWNYGVVIPNSGVAFTGPKIDDTPLYIKLANENPQVPLHVITFWQQISPKKAGYGNFKRATINTNSLDSNLYIKFKFNGKNTKQIRFDFPDSLIKIDGYTQKFYLSQITQKLTRPINLINENGEEPPGPYLLKHLKKDSVMIRLKDSLKIDSWEIFMAEQKLRLRNTYSNCFMKEMPELKNTSFTIYTVEGGPIDRFNWTVMKKSMTPINGNYYSTPDFYPRWAKNWKDWMGAWHGWKWIETGRKTEINDGDKLFSPFVAAGWSKKQEDDIRPGQWLGLLKCLSVIGAEFYYVGYFSLSSPFINPGTWAWQAAMPAYAQAITSRFEDVLRDGNVLFNEKKQPIISYRTSDKHVLVTIRKHQQKEKYIIAGTYQPFSNDSASTPEIKTVTIPFNNQELTFDIRKQGSVYVYEILQDGRNIFYQLDTWHESTHPDYWSKDFLFEAEVNDAPLASEYIYTESDTIHHYHQFTSFVKLSHTHKLTYQFIPRDSLHTPTHIWIRYRGNGKLESTLNHQKSDCTNLKSTSHWKWAAINLKQAMEYNKLQTLELKLDKGQLEIDKIYISTKDQINLP